MSLNALEYGQVSDSQFFRPMPEGMEFTGCLGAAEPSVVPLKVVPYVGKFDACATNRPPRFLTNATVPPGVSPYLEPRSADFNVSGIVQLTPVARMTFQLGSVVRRCKLDPSLKAPGFKI